MRIRDVQWPPGIREKVERKHGLSQYQVEAAVLSSRPYIRRARDNRYYVFGQSDDGAYVMSVIVYVGGSAQMISARQMTAAEKRVYLRRGK